MERRLAAILSADAVAYSRLMAEDEEGTARSLSESRRLIGDQVAQHSGRVVDAPGDNLLAEFPSAVDAVRCAVEIQAELARRNADVAPERRLLFRIGVNLGDVLVEGERIVGDGVNVAARLEALAEPGGICVSGPVFDQVEGKTALPFLDAGAQQVKNMSRPVRVYRIQLEPTSIRSRPRRSWRVPALAAAMLLLLAAAGLWLWMFQEPPVRNFSELESALEPPRGPAIAVLPFDNLSGDPEQDYFSHGLTEDIATALSRFPGLRVVSPRVASAPRDVEGDPARLAAALGVRYVIRGSVRRSPAEVRVAARLLDASSGAQLWAETYDRSYTAASLFAVQDDIAQRVVATLADPTGVLAHVGQQELRRRTTDSLEAYDCVLRGYTYLEIHTDENHLRARDCLERAVELDPDYADAWAHLAYLYREEFHHDRNVRPNSLDRALQAAERALELDPMSPMAHYALAQTHYSRGDLEGLKAEAERAIELNPNDTTVLAAFAVNLAFAGDWERGAALARRAAALNPSHPDWLYMMVSADHYRQGRYEEALEELARWNQRGDSRWHLHRAAIYGQLGRRREADAEIDALVRAQPAFAEEPVRELRKYFLSEELADAYLEGLRKAGLEVGE